MQNIFVNWLILIFKKKCDKINNHKNYKVVNINSLFNKNVQPFLISWLKYNPQAEIKKLMIPTLIINGSKNLQVNNLDAKLLNKANLNSELEIIQNMNHILKEIKGDMTENMNSYANPELPIMPELVEIISAFIKK